MITSLLPETISKKNLAGGLGPNKFPHPADFPVFIPEPVPASNSNEPPRTHPQSDWTEVEWSLLRNLLIQFMDQKTGKWYSSLLDGEKEGSFQWSKVLPLLETLNEKVIAHYSRPGLTNLPVFPCDSKGPSPYL